MSEYTPITGELRGAMRQWGWVESDGSITFTSSSLPTSIDAEKSLAISGSDFDRCCDAIDSIHAQLERENESLKAELARVLGEQDRDGWIELPRDADGVPIRVGDTVEDADNPTELLTVSYIELEEKGWWVFTGGVGRRPDRYRHAQPDTWERIIEDAIGEGMARQRNNDSGNFCERANPMNNGDLVARCKALCERTKEAVE